MTIEPAFKPFMRQMTSDLLSPEAKLQLALSWLDDNRLPKQFDVSMYPQSIKESKQ